MRIIQTFWTAGRDPKQDGFGWLHPEYNLMSWTLSCLSLRQHYDEVVLYTDTAGKRILVDELHLPYTDVQVVFDGFQCLSQHWALAKIKTYSMQTEPFLHVDGDVYISRPIPESILSAPLIAQNREIGTGYYRRMMDNIMAYKDIHLSDAVLKGLRDESIASYNMGFFGGRDVEFIHRYCDTVFRFMEENRMNDPECPHSKVDCNVFFEQMLFALLADTEKKEVASILGRSMEDEGYTVKEFCDLTHFHENPFFHILGGHKRNQAICEVLERNLLRFYDENFWNLIHLFPDKNWRLSGMEKPNIPFASVERCIAHYEDNLEKLRRKWESIPPEELYAYEKKMVSQEPLIEADEDYIKDLSLQRNTYLDIFTFPENWHPKALDLLRRRLRAKHALWSFEIAVLPSLTGDGLREVPIATLGHNILTLLQGGPQTIASLTDELSVYFSKHLNLDQDKQRKLILSELDYLAYYGIIEIN